MKNHNLKIKYKINVNHTSMNIKAATATDDAK